MFRPFPLLRLYILFAFLVLWSANLQAEESIPPALVEQLKQVQVDSLNIVQFQKFATAVQQEAAQIFTPLPQLLQAYMQQKISFAELNQALNETQKQLDTLQQGMRSYPLYRGMSQTHFNRLFQSQQDWASTIKAYQTSLSWEQKYLNESKEEFQQQRQEELDKAKQLNQKARQRLQVSLLQLQSELEQVKRQIQQLQR